MRRPATDLWPTVVSFANLHAAFLKARRGKRRRPDVAAFEQRLEDHLVALQDELAAGSYRPGAYRSFPLSERGKSRIISAAPFRDRVVHHAISNVLEPLLERSFIPWSFASRPGRGTHKALAHARRLADRHRFCLKADVARYFPSIDHALLKAHIRQWVADPRLLALLGRIIDGGAGVGGEPAPGWLAGDDLFAALRPRGLPLGNQTSQLLANLFLHPLDVFVTGTLRPGGYARYVDDFLLFGDDSRQLERHRAAVIDFLAGLRLRLHGRKREVLAVENGIEFVGFVLLPHTTRLRRANVDEAKARLRRLARARRAGRMTAAEAGAAARSWCAHAAHGDTAALRGALLRDLR